MQFEEMGNMSGKILMLLPGTCCDWQGLCRHVSIITRLIFKKNTSKHMKEWMFHINQKR